MQYEDHENNRATLTGIVSDIADNKRSFVLTINRLSGQQDRIPVNLSDEVPQLNVHEGQIITALGQFTSFNQIVGDRSKLILSVHATIITEAQNDDHFNPNNIELVGFICKPHIFKFDASLGFFQSVSAFQILRPVCVVQKFKYPVTGNRRRLHGIVSFRQFIDRAEELPDIHGKGIQHADFQKTRVDLAHAEVNQDDDANGVDHFHHRHHKTV